ncbi:cytochrome c oxidase assembly factor 7 homolog [Littorina saxatilis]|uniref:Cytochrome c oxidase assembly factor 7 n=1 Tax=Littorina saxatilis TaxID=31220 RepID=A0AAN9G983_9CAEN
MQYDLKDENQAKEYLKNVGIEYRYQCYQEKNPEGCHRLADFFESVKKEFEKAALVFKSNCDQSKYGHSCFKYGNYRVTGKGSEKDADVGVDYYLKGCEYDYVPACHNAALLLHSEKLGSTHDPERAVKLLKHGCEYKHVASCYQLSGWFLQGTKSITKDMAQAFEFSQKACDLGNCYACANLSQMYRKGEGVAQDTKQAEQYRLKAKELYDEMTQARRNITLN